MRKIIMWIGIIGIIIVFFTFVLCCVNPLRMSKEIIKNNLIKEIPLGTNKMDVIKIINSRPEWHIIVPSVHSPEDFSNQRSVFILLGGYRSFFRVDVDAEFHFGKNLKLIDIVVRKHTDSL